MAKAKAAAAKKRPPARPAARQRNDDVTRSTGPAGHATAPWSGGPVRRGEAIKVRATKLGYYDHKRQRIGDVFRISSMDVFSEKWMELVDPTTPNRTTTGNQALRQHHDETLAARHSARKGGGATGAADVLGDAGTVDDDGE